MIELRPARNSELPLFHALEQDPDTAPYILETTLRQHREAFARDDITYLSIGEHGRFAGYLILARDADGISIELRRIVVAERGKGTGKRAMRAVEPYCREVMRRQRIWLDVFDFNRRGRRVYQDLGYRQFDESEFEGKRLLYFEKNL